MTRAGSWRSVRRAFGPAGICLDHEPKKSSEAPCSSGAKVLRLWLQAADPTFAEIAGLVGLDFVIIDQEHGPGGVQSAIDMMRALSGSATTAMIRVPSSDPTYLKRIVDAGAQAILVPMVDTAVEAKRSSMPAATRRSGGAATPPAWCAGRGTA